MKAGTVEHPRAVTTGLLNQWPLPLADGDKNASGRVLVVGGNAGVPGAVLLAGEAALRAGAGKLRVLTVASVAPVLGVALPEAYVVGVDADDDGELSITAADQIVELGRQSDAVLLGPGFKNTRTATRLLRRVVPKLDCAVCLDALALAYLTDDVSGVRHLAGRCVLTPNPTELFKTLGGEPPQDPNSPEGTSQLLAAAVRLAATADATVVTGAATSFVARPDGGLFLADGGSQGLAVSGSGDVKAGIISGLLARGAAPDQAAVWGEHVHGRCGERLVSEFGPRGFLPRDLLPLIPRVVTELES